MREMTLSALLESLCVEHVLYVSLAVLLLVAVYLIVKRPFGFGLLEGFDGELSTGTTYEEAHGSAPAGVNAAPGLPQYQQNAGDEHVNPVYRDGNPQNTNDDLKKQPDFNGAR